MEGLGCRVKGLGWMAWRVSVEGLRGRVEERSEVGEWGWGVKGEGGERGF